MFNGNKGVIADADGKFKIQTDKDSLHLRISATGFASLEYGVMQ